MRDDDNFVAQGRIDIFCARQVSRLLTVLQHLTGWSSFAWARISLVIQLLVSEFLMISVILHEVTTWVSLCRIVVALYLALVYIPSMWRLVRKLEQWWKNFDADNVLHLEQIRLFDQAIRERLLFLGLTAIFGVFACSFPALGNILASFSWMPLILAMYFATIMRSPRKTVFRTVWDKARSIELPRLAPLPSPIPLPLGPS